LLSIWYSCSLNWIALWAIKIKRTWKSIKKNNTFYFQKEKQNYNISTCTFWLWRWKWDSLQLIVAPKWTRMTIKNHTITTYQHFRFLFNVIKKKIKWISDQINSFFNGKENYPIGKTYLKMICNVNKLVWNMTMVFRLPNCIGFWKELFQNIHMLS
jgi:hypothetical protein